MIEEFERLGWKWGGSWANPTDYQHFEKPIPGPSYCR
ncbi:M15 family metallopeptidase [Klebsiella variicola]